jgi:coenzyme F420-dependent glucose-6-phosphate dehydrogenase
MASTEALGDGSLELGYWLSSEEHTPGALVAHARAAEETGFRIAMISDHFAPWVPHQGNSSFVWSVLGAIGASTRQLRVGTGVTAAVHRVHPLVIAHAAATVESLMPGRFFLGLGTGERLNEGVTGERWPRPAERRAMLEEALSIMRDLWDGRTVSHQGDHFRVERARLYTRPDTPPPVVIAASGKASARLAGEQADGVLSIGGDPEVVDAFEGAGGHGKPRFAQLDVCWAESDDAARRTVREWWPNAAVPGPLLTELATPPEFAQVCEVLPDDVVQRAVVSGPDPERYVGAIAHCVAGGFTTVHLHQVGPDQCGFLDFCARELLPRFSTT